MGLKLANIHSLSDFQRNAKDHIRKLKASGKPSVLTVNGEAEVVVQSAESYQELLDDRELLDSIRSISRGLEQAKRGEGRAMRVFLESLAKEHGISLIDVPGHRHSGGANRNSRIFRAHSREIPSECCTVATGSLRQD
jgi:PHD/YefM family antitoxin component YafN of YafNO toxin-antitoxin module